MKALEERRKDLMASYPVWKKMTLYQGLASKAAECPNHVFLLVEGRRYTYGEVLREADHISAAFGAMGLARGGCVAVALSNRIEFVTITFALAKAGAVKVPVNRNASPRELEYILWQTGARFLITERPVEAEEGGRAVPFMGRFSGKGQGPGQGDALDGRGQHFRHHIYIGQHRAAERSDAFT